MIILKKVRVIDNFFFKENIETHLDIISKTIVGRNVK